MSSKTFFLKMLQDCFRNGVLKAFAETPDMREYSAEFSQICVSELDGIIGYLESMEQSGSEYRDPVSQKTA